MNEEKFITYLQELLSIPSPTGMTDEVSAYVCSKLKNWDVDHTVNRRGTITARIKGKSEAEAKALISHLDTLGLIVSELKENGRIAIRDIGYITCRMVEGARITIHSRGKKFSGTVLPLKTSNHIYDHHPINNQEGTWKNLEIRLDEKSASKKELVELGISVGDIVSIHPNTEITSSGFIVSRFLDNHGSTACLLETIEEIVNSSKKLPNDVYFVFTTNEELDGSGARFIPDNVSEVLAVDIAPVGGVQTSSEYTCTIGAKDYEMVYDRALIEKLINLCQKNSINYCVDVFHNLSTDALNVITSSKDVLAGYIAFGVDSSHAYERTHIDAITNLKKLISAYIFG